MAEIKTINDLPSEMNTLITSFVKAKPDEELTLYELMTKRDKLDELILQKENETIEELKIDLGNLFKHQHGELCFRDDEKFSETRNRLLFERGNGMICFIICEHEILDETIDKYWHEEEYQRIEKKYKLYLDGEKCGEQYIGYLSFVTDYEEE